MRPGPRWPPTTRSSCGHLPEHVREGFAKLDAGDIDVFELDDLIHHYKRSARELWKLCGSSGSESERAASMLAYLREQDDEPDWWEAGAPPATPGNLFEPAPGRQRR